MKIDFYIGLSGHTFHFLPSVSLSRVFSPVTANTGYEFNIGIFTIMMGFILTTGKLKEIDGEDFV